MQCTALVIDDEPLARKRMVSLLEPFSSEIEILGEAGSGAQGTSSGHHRGAHHAVAARYQ